VFNQVGAAQVQACLREAFGLWGLPGGLKLDNGLPWGGWSDLPTALALWLAGLGIELHFSPPGQKQLNGVVERSQGTGQRWCEPGTCATAAELQRRLDEMDRIQREEYPSWQGQSRLAMFPQLRQPARPYTRAWEEAHWNLGLAQEYLAGHTAVRRANKQGQVSVYDHRYSVGAKQRGQAILVYYDPGSEEWVFAEATSGQQLRRYKAVEITRERIVGLQVSG
jgi:hypothetical protein